MLILYWDERVCPTYIYLTKTDIRDRINLFFMAALPRRNSIVRQRLDGKVFQKPTAAEFKKIYHDWLETKWER